MFLIFPLKPLASRLAGMCGLLLGMALLVLQTGCTSTTGLVALAQTHPTQPIKILVLQAPMSADPKRLKALYDKESSADPSIANDVLHAQINLAQQRAQTDMNQALANQHTVVVVPTPRDDAVITAVATADFAAVMSQAEADQIAQATGAEAILRYRITDYGLTPVAWRHAYVTFEIASTLGVAGGVALIGTKVAKSAALVYLAEEGTEELLEGYAGFWAFNEICRPVRIEAALIRLRPVKTIWKISDTGRADVRFSRLIRKVGADELDGQLLLSTDHAASSVVKRLTAPLAHQEMRP